MEIWTYLYVISLVLLVAEATIFSGGYILSAALTCFLLGVLNWIDLVKELNHFLWVGTLSFIGFSLLIVGLFRLYGVGGKKNQDYDINNY